MKIHMIYLAAGNSRRFGSNKLLYDFHGMPLYQYGFNQLLELLKKHDIKIDKRKFINARPIQALGYTRLEIELYKDVIATIKVHLQEK